MQNRLTAAFAAVLLAAGGGVSNANPFWAGPHASTPIAEGSWYAGIGGSAGVLRRPSWRRVGAIFPRTATSGPSAPNLNVDMFGGGPTLSLGYVLPKGALPPWAGRRVRLELAGSIIHGSGSDRFSVTTAPNAQIVFINLDGVVFAGGGALAQTSTEILKQELLSYTGTLRVASDVHLSPGLYLTPSLGISGGHTAESFKFRQLLNFAVGTQITMGANEELSTQRFAGQAGLGLTWQARAWLALNLSGQVGVVWRRARLTGHDCVQAQGSVACGGGLAAGFRTSVISNSRSAVGVRTGISMGLKFIVWGATLHIGGFFNWDSAVPGVNNPAVTQFHATGTSIGAARVSFFGAWNAGGLIMIRIPFGGAGAHQD